MSPIQQLSSIKSLFTITKLNTCKQYKTPNSTHLHISKTTKSTSQKTVHKQTKSLLTHLSLIAKKKKKKKKTLYTMNKKSFSHSFLLC